MASHEEIKEQIKKYIAYCRSNKDKLFGKNKNRTSTNSFLNSLNLPWKIRERLDFELTKTLEYSSTSSVDGYMTPFAFSSRSDTPGNVRAAKSLGFTLVDKPKGKGKTTKHILEGGQVYPGWDGIRVAPDNIDGELTYIDDSGLPQHGDPNEDPELDGRAQSIKAMQNAMYEKINKRLNQKNKLTLVNPKMESASISLKNILEDLPLSAQTHTKQSRNKIYHGNIDKQQNQTIQGRTLDSSNYDVLKDFSQFDIALKKATEEVKLRYQKTIQDKIIGKKVILRAAKGFKQPESDYTVNVTGVQLDYYYDRYVLIVVGREEQKQKIFKFFVKPGFKLKIIGDADIKDKDEYHIAKSNTIVNKNNQNDNDFDNTNITAQ